MSNENKSEQLDVFLTEIGDAIREVKGTTGLINARDMAGIVRGMNGEISLQEKTVTPTTNSQSVTPDSDYDGLSKVTVNAISTTTLATPTISVSSGGLITASSTQNAGYVVSGTRSATKQLTTQSAKTITPSTSSQTAVASGVYTTGAITVGAIPSSYVKPTTTKGATTYTPTTSNQTIASGTYLSGTQTIKGDANLVADNIKNGVSIFGVNGTYEGSGGGGGGSAETCNVTAESLYANIYCVDPITGTLIKGEPFDNYIDDYKTYTVLKNSIICVTTNEWGYQWTVDNGEILTDISDDTMIVVHITGDCIISSGV